MEKPEHHIFVCMSFRGLEPKGKCIRKNAPELLGYLESELADRGMNNVMVSTTGCLKLCDNGPIMVVYPTATGMPGWKGRTPSMRFSMPWKKAALRRTFALPD
jgi:predicted metal-binding protein